ncbi:MAG TPA: peptidase inhibitor family I36 protein [Sporichthyaceae bacterium]|nr:peptidase inhibitor family I36 protein [Sporichthyaceae bacterium]
MRLVHALAGPAALVALVPMLVIHPAAASAAGLDQCASHKVCFWSKPGFQGLPQFDDADPNSDCAGMDHVQSVWYRDGSPGVVLELWHDATCAGPPDAVSVPGWKADDFVVGSYKLEVHATVTPAAAFPKPTHRGDSLRSQSARGVFAAA